MQKSEELVLHNVSELLQQLGHQIDAREQQLQQKTETHYHRNEKLVSNNIVNLFGAIIILMREVVKRSFYHTLKHTSDQLQQRFELSGSGSVAFVAQGTEAQEQKQNEVTILTLKNTQRVWKEALKATQPPETDVETALMTQAQQRFKQLDCHRRVLVVALQTYQTNHLHHEIDFMEKVYRVKTQNLQALWQRLVQNMDRYQEEQARLVSITDQALAAIQKKTNTLTQQLAADVKKFYERFKKLWNAYKVNTQLVDDTSTEANNLRVALDTLLSSFYNTNNSNKFDFIQAVELLQKHWQATANHVEGCTVVGSAAVKPKVSPQKAALQKNADKMLFCAKNRAQVLQNAKAYRNTPTWIQALKKWDAAMKQLELEAQVLRKAENSTEVVPAQINQLCDNHDMIVSHRQWKRLVFSLGPLSQKLQERQRTVQTQSSTMYAVLLNKVGYELKHGLDAVLTQALALEQEHTDAERAHVEAEEANFKVLSEKYQNDSRYMDSELQGYGDAANKCRELVTKLFHLKTWQEHATHLQQQLQLLQPLVVQVSKHIQVV